MAGFLARLLAPRKRQRIAADDIVLIERSRFFDRAWYLNQYTDVQQSKVDPARHYLEHGANEGRDPGPRFSSKGYLTRYPDVAQDGFNPLLHYLRHGETEGRIVTSFPDRNEGESDDGRDILVVPKRDRLLNAAEAAKNPQSVAASAMVLDKFIQALPKPDSLPANAVPPIFHFVYGFKSSGDLPYFGYMAIKSAVHFNPGWKVLFHCMHEPAGERWESIKSHLSVIRLDDFEYFGKSRLYHYAHKADIVRLLALKHTGGIYLDIDTITQRSYDDLRGSDFCMGVQAAGPDSASGLCNAVMIGRPGAEFLENWITQYEYFRSRGRDDLWDYHSVKLPGILMGKNPESITVLDYRSFFFPLWNTIESVLFGDAGAKFGEDLSVAYCFHLWNGASGSFLETIDEHFVKTSGSIYAQISRQVEGIRS